MAQKHQRDSSQKHDLNWRLGKMQNWSRQHFQSYLALCMAVLIVASFDV